MDLDGLALDRAEAAERAMFDPGKEATLARKYEASATRELYRALREFRAVQATGQLADPNLFDAGELPIEATDVPLPEAIEAGDAVDPAEVGLAMDGPKSMQFSDL